MKNITRYSNRQNAVRGRDFLTLEDEFQRLKQQLQKQHYYLEVQTGEYDVLPKAVKEPFPRSRLINAFDAAAETGLPPQADRPASAMGLDEDSYLTWLSSPSRWGGLTLATARGII